MFAWPRFAAHLGGAGSAEERVLSLLVELAERISTASAADVLSELFGDGDLVDEVAHLAPRVDHIGFIAPRELGAAAIEQVLARSPFREQRRKVKSAILARELSSRLGREVEMTIVQGGLMGHRSRRPAVEIFVADLARQELEELVVKETGCHVALALEPSGSVERLRHVLHANDCWEIPLMRGGPLANHEMRASVLYVDVPGRESTRRLEFITSQGL